MQSESDDNIELEKKEKTIRLLPNSTLVFAINRAPVIPCMQSIQEIFEEYILFIQNLQILKVTRP